MKILITGATGFVGAHTARELLESGHEVRLLVRDKTAAQRYFNAHGHQIEDIVVADILDRDAVAPAMQGCDALVHSAALVSLDPSRAEAVYKTNVDGLKNVVETALEAGVNNILHVSSFTVLFDPKATMIDEHSPLATFNNAYAKSKRDGEVWVRALQANGAPIQISYPGGVKGPDDPRLSESNGALRSFVRATMLDTSGGTLCVDVRDIAKMHRWMLENPNREHPTEARYLLAGHYYRWPDYRRVIESVLQRPVKHASVPGWVLRLAGRLFDVVRLFRRVDAPMSTEAMTIMTQCPEASSQKIINASGLSFRPVEETIKDALLWMVSASYLRPKHIAPGLASDSE